MAKHRWIIEQDYEELKQKLGLGHFEGRNWRGFHHHATLCIAAYGFLVAERNRFSRSARAARRPERHNSRSIATIRIAIARVPLRHLPQCPFCGLRSG
jgi:SRSO17 transposase